MDTATATINDARSLIDIEQEAISLRQEINAVVITDQATYDLAVEKRTAAAAWLKKAREFFKGMKDPAYAAWKKICSNENLVCDPVDSEIKGINRALVNWEQEQERKRREEQRKLDEEARKKAEEDQLATAIQLEEQGAPAEAVEAVISAPIAVHSPVVAAPTYAKSSAVVMRDNWKGECFDLHALIKAAAKDKSLVSLLTVNQTALNQQAKSLKENMQIAGCRAVNDRGVATGRG